ncbi:unnamed protein product [Ectocarpus sp. 8 AP-2014]
MMHSSRHGDRRYHPQPQREHQPGQDNQHAASPSAVSSWGVTYLLQSAKRGWQRHKSPHVASLDAVNNCLDVTDAATSRLQERVDLTEGAAVGAIEVAFVAAAAAQNIVRFTLLGHPVRKFALIAESGRSAAELCQALDRQVGVSVRGMEDLPDAVFLRGGDQRTAQALEAGIPNLSRPEVQAYIVRLLFQDSFHEFVSDLSEMFSHVQTHLPVPTSTPVRTSASDPRAAAAAAAAAAASHGGSGEDSPCGGRQADDIAHGGNGGRDSGVLNEGRRVSVGSFNGEEVVSTGGGSRAVGGEERLRGEGDPVAGSGGRGKEKGKAHANRGRGGRGKERGRGRGGGRESHSAKPLGARGSRRGSQQRDDGTGGTGPGGAIDGVEDDIRTAAGSPCRGGVPPAPHARRAKRPATEEAAAEAAMATTVTGGKGSARGAAKGSTQQRPAPPAKRARTQQQQQQQQQRECGVGGDTSGFTQSLASGDGKGTNGSRSSGGGGGDKAPSRRGPVSRTGAGEAGTVVASARGVASSGRAAREGSGGQQVTGTGANGGGAGHPKASGNENSKTSARKKKNRTAGAAPSAATSSGSSATVAAACKTFASAAPRTGGGLGGGAAAAAVAAAGGRQGDTMPGVTPIMSPVTSSGRAPGLWTTLKKMWSEVNKHRSSWAFRKGVDPTTAPGYLDVVKHPIDLEGIRKRLDGPVVHYTNKAMLQDDLELMCRNAMLYNDEETEYHRVAEDLLRFIESMFAR